MSKPKKLMLGLITLWPIVYGLAFVSFVFAGFFFGPGTQSPSVSSVPANALAGNGVPAWFIALAALHMFTGVLMIALVAIYIRHIFKTERVAQDKKALWGVCIFLGNIIAMPIYWYLYIWKEPHPD